MTKKTTKQIKKRRVTATKKKAADIRYREYWRDNERFADLFNTVVFAGETVIYPDKLSEMDTRVSRLIPEMDFERGIERTRDVMKSYKGTKYLLLGVENQTHVHYGMPLKSLTYNVLGYIDEVNQLSASRRKEGGLTSAEFLSGMRKEDKLTPIVTIVIYYGEEPWNGPLSFSEMFDRDTIRYHLNQTEHRIILLQVSESDHYHFQNEDTETIFSISRELFRGNMEHVKQKYATRELSQEIIAMIGSITKFKGMEREAQRGETNMCKAIDAIFEQERIKIEEHMCKGIRDALDKERLKTEERIRKEQEVMLEQERLKTEERIRKEHDGILERERIKTFVEVLKEFQCETDEIILRVCEKYKLSQGTARTYL